MKLRVVITILIFLATSFSYPQELRNYGIKIGLTSSSISINNIKPITNGDPGYYVKYPEGQLVSPTISFWAKLITSKILDFEVEVTYILKGSSEIHLEIVTPGNDPDLITEVYKSVTFKYLQFNTNSQIKQNIGKFWIYGIAGPAVGYLIKAENFVLLNNFKKDFIWGYNLGLGIEYNKSIIFEIKYNGDFTSFYKNDYEEFWNKVWVFNLGTSL